MTKKNNHITTYNQELSILLSKYGLSFMIRKPDDQKFFEYLFEADNPSKLDIELQKIIEERSLFLQDFDRINIIHHNRLNTLVPQSVFKPSDKKIWLNQNIRLLDGDTVNYEYIDFVEAVNIYVPFEPLSVDSQLLKIYHQHSSFIFFKNIHSIQSKQKALPVFEIFLNIFPKDFQVAVFKNQNLQVYNHFEYENIDEFLYYLFFVTETLQIDDIKTQIYIMGIEQTDDLIESLKTFTNNISVLPAKIPGQINNFV